MTGPPVEGLMSEEDRLALIEIVQQERAKFSENLELDKFFEIFSAEQVLKSRDYDLDSDQVVAGVMGGGGDGGADSFYVMVNNKMVREDTDLNTLKGQKLSIDVVIVQSKNKNSFGETAIKNFQDLTDNCLRLSADLNTASRVLYSEALLDSIKRFHTIYKNALSDRPRLRIAFYYASLYDKPETSIDKKVTTRRDKLLATLTEFFSRAECTFEFAGAKKLYDWFHITRPKTRTLEAIKHMPGPKLGEKPGKSYVALVTLSKFFDFITIKDKLQEWMFEANVRDFQGDVEVNNDIGETLAGAVPEDFWWLNNGITIIASEASGDGDFLTVTDPMIVNGLQTSYKIYNYLSGIATQDSRTILVRVLESNDSGASDRIIKATNNQTRIPKIWLHATEGIQRMIETELKKVGLYYDRRKNYYRNQGIPVKQVVTIPYLSQALIAILLQKPDDARARPTTAAEKHYIKLFSEAVPRELYSKCALILKRIDQFLYGLKAETDEKANVRFYLAMYAVCEALRSPSPRKGTIAAFNIELLTDDLLAKCYARLQAQYQEFGASDTLAKSPDWAMYLRRELKDRFSQGKKNEKDMLRV